MNQNQARKHQRNHIRESTIEMELFCYNLFFVKHCINIVIQAEIKKEIMNIQMRINMENVLVPFVFILVVSNKIGFHVERNVQCRAQHGCSVKLATFDEM